MDVSNLVQPDLQYYFNDSLSISLDCQSLSRSIDLNEKFQFMKLGWTFAVLLRNLSDDTLCLEIKEKKHTTVRVKVRKKIVWFKLRETLQHVPDVRWAKHANE